MCRLVMGLLLQLSIMGDWSGILNRLLMDLLAILIQHLLLLMLLNRRLLVFGREHLLLDGLMVHLRRKHLALLDLVVWQRLQCVMLLLILRLDRPVIHPLLVLDVEVDVFAWVADDLTEHLLGWRQVSVLLLLQVLLLRLGRHVTLDERALRLIALLDLVGLLHRWLLRLHDDVLLLHRLGLGCGNWLSGDLLNRELSLLSVLYWLLDGVLLLDLLLLLDLRSLILVLSRRLLQLGLWVKQTADTVNALRCLLRLGVILKRHIYRD
jgi:hypothetical protein